MERKRFAKGTPITFICCGEDDYIRTVPGITSIFRQDYGRNTGVYVVQGFVSGDEPGKGLSIVALDNPELCLYAERPGCSASEEDLRQLYNGYRDRRTLNIPWGSPTCAYS